MSREQLQGENLSGQEMLRQELVGEQPDGIKIQAIKALLYLVDNTGVNIPSEYVLARFKGPQGSIYEKAYYRASSVLKKYEDTSRKKFRDIQKGHPPDEEIVTYDAIKEMKSDLIKINEEKMKFRERAARSQRAQRMSRIR